MKGKRKRSREGGKERDERKKKDDLRIVSLSEWEKGSVHPFPKQGS